MHILLLVVSGVLAGESGNRIVDYRVGLTLPIRRAVKRRLDWLASAY